MPPPAAIETLPLGNVILPKHPKRSSANEIDGPTHAKRAFYSGNDAGQWMLNVKERRKPVAIVSMANDEVQ